MMWGKIVRIGHSGSSPRADVTLTAGTRMVPVDQSLGRLIFMLLEPSSDEGLVSWNVLDDALEASDVYPVVRSVQ